jgi:hypothetical protein
MCFIIVMFRGMNYHLSVWGGYGMYLQTPLTRIGPYSVPCHSVTVSQCILYPVLETEPTNTLDWELRNVPQYIAFFYSP